MADDRHAPALSTSSTGMSGCPDRGDGLDRTTWLDGVQAALDARQAHADESLARVDGAVRQVQRLREVDRTPGGKPPDIRAVVIGLGRLVGAHLSKRQPLPGAKKVWQGLEQLSWAVQVRDALGERRRE